jgi:hypothetical protein
MSMPVIEVLVTREKARELMKAYRLHRSAQTPEDRAIERAYREIASGRVLIRALDSIKAAGLDEHGRPKLALARADHRRVRMSIGVSRDAQFYPLRWTKRPGRWSTAQWETTRHEAIVVPGLRAASHTNAADAMVPLIPVHLRPQTAIENYHILWEAEWSEAPPVDPMLLRRLGGDLWIVVAAWDLTEIERAVMASRVAG